MVRRILLSVLMLFAMHTMQANAQQAKYMASGSVLSHSEEGDGSVLTPVSGAVVQLVSPSDTLYTVTDNQGRFAFRKVVSPHCTISVECLGFETWVKEFNLADPLSGWISVVLKEKKEKIDAAVVRVEAPVFEFIGDTLKYNVASTQKVSGDDMLRDVFERLPGISMENNVVKIMNEEVAKIYINGKLVFGDDIGDPLSYLAGSEVVSLKVYDQATKEERLGLIPKGSKKERVVNVLTRNKINSALVAQAIAGYGRNFENTGSETDNRYTAGVTGNFFSEKTLLSANVYLNNIGRTNEYSAVSDISSVPSAYSRIGYAGVKLVKKFRDAEMGDILSANYSYGNTKRISERSLSRAYLPDENWTSRTYRQDSRTLSRSDAHNIGVSYMSILPYIPHLDLSFSAAGDQMSSISLMEDIVDGVRGGYNQSMSEKRDEYRFASHIGKSFGLWGVNIGADVRLSGGHSFGNTLQRDTTLASSSVTSFVSEPQGKSFKADVNLRIAKSILNNKWILNGNLDYNHQNESVYKLRYEDAVAEANLDMMTSDVHTYKYDTYRATIGMQSQRSVYSMLNVSVAAQYDHQRRDIVMPGKIMDGKDYFSIYPFLSFVYRKGYASRISLNIMARPILPSYEQIRRDFDATNPMYISRGNPDLKMATDYKLEVGGTYMLAQSHSLDFGLVASYVGNRIITKTTYLTEDVTIDDYQMPKGATFSTYDNVDGAMYTQAMLKWVTTIKPLKLKVSAIAKYGFSRDPSYIEEQLNIAHRHVPAATFEISTNFSSKYRVDIKSNTSSSFVYNSRYTDVSYLDQNLSVNSRNKITDWMFINGQYVYSLRHPFEGGASKLQDHMLNAIVGFAIKKSGVEINLTCYDILNRTSSFKTTVLRNYTQTSFSPDFGRIWMVTAVWRFNSTQRGGRKINFGHASPALGRDYEKETSRIRY